MVDKIIFSSIIEDMIQHKNSVKTFKEYIEYSPFVSFYKGELVEMTNIDPKIHKFGIDVKIHIQQPADKKLPHGPRLKIFKNKRDVFVITLPKDVRDVKIKGDASFLKSKEVSTLANIAKHYKEAFVSFWCDEDMGVGELMDYIEAINLNDFKKLDELRKEHPITCY